MKKETKAEIIIIALAVAIFISGFLTANVFLIDKEYYAIEYVSTGGGKSFNIIVRSSNPISASDYGGEIVREKYPDYDWSYKSIKIIK